MMSEEEGHDFSELAKEMGVDVEFVKKIVEKGLRIFQESGVGYSSGAGSGSGSDF